MSRRREDRGARERKIEGAIVDAEKRKRRKTREEENLPRSTSAVREAISNYFFLQNNYASSVHRTSSSRSYRTITVGRYRAELIDFSFRDSLTLFQCGVRRSFRLCFRKGRRNLKRRNSLFFIYTSLTSRTISSLWYNSSGSDFTALWSVLCDNDIYSFTKTFKFIHSPDPAIHFYESHRILNRGRTGRE